MAKETWCCHIERYINTFFLILCFICYFHLVVLVTYHNKTVIVSRFFFPQGSVSTLNKLLNTVMGFITSEAICFPVIGKPGIEINIWNIYDLSGNILQCLQEFCLLLAWPCLGSSGRAMSIMELMARNNKEIYVCEM